MLVSFTQPNARQVWGYTMVLDVCRAFDVAHRKLSHAQHVAGTLAALRYEACPEISHKHLSLGEWRYSSTYCGLPVSRRRNVVL